MPQIGEEYKFLNVFRLSFTKLSITMSGWSTPTFSFPSYTAMYRTFHPDESTGLALLIELIVFLRQGPMAMDDLVDIIHNINEGIQHSDITTFIENNCHNLSFIITDGSVKCKYVNR